MDLMLIIRIVLYVVLGGIALYFNYNTKLNQNVTGYIKDAEEFYKDSTKAGGEKFDWVCDQLYRLIPAPFRLVFTEEMIDEIVQKAFDAIENYAKTQLDKKLNNK